MSEPLSPPSPGFPAEWGKELPSFGSDWDRAIEFGIDVSLLLENLSLSPEDRLRQLQRVVEFHEQLRAARPGGD